MKKIYFLISCLFICTQLISQSKIYQVAFDETPLEDVVSILESQYGLLFSYKSADIETVRVSATIKTSHLDQLLQTLLEKSNCDFEIISGNYIIIKSQGAIKKAKLCGYIIDSKSKSPLPFANIIVEQTSIGASTTEDGYFELTIPYDIKQRLLISYIGYEDRRISCDKMKPEDCISIPLIIDEQITPYLIIKDYITDGINLTDNGSATTMQPSKIGSLPGQVEPNVMRSIQFLPGISSPSSKASDIYIRGGTPDQNLIIWEDIPIYHSAHYFGMISAIDPYTVSKMSVYRGGFGAEYGGRISGVIDIEAQDEKSTAANFAIGSNMTHAYINGLQKLGQEKKTAISFSLRRSFNELVETPTFRNITEVNQQGFIIGSQEDVVGPSQIRISNDFNFLDSHFKFSSQLNSSDRIEVAGLFADNSFVDRITDERRKEAQTDSMVIHNMGASIKWEHLWNDNLSTTLKGVMTSYDYGYEYNFIEVDRRVALTGLKENKIVDKQLAFITQYTGKANQVLEGGYHLINYNIDFKVSETSRIRGPQRTTSDSGSSQSNLHCLYVSYKSPVAQKLGLNIGLRSSYFDINQKVYVEPRLRLAYNLSDHINVSANYGRHYQFVGQVTEFRGSEVGLSLPVWAMAEDKSIPIQSADLFQLGGIYQKRGFVLDIQLYKKKVEGLSSRAYDLELVEDGFPQVGSADIKGVDILVKKRFNSIKSWLSYSYCFADLQFDRLQRESFPADYDQRHVLQWSNQLSWRKFQLGLGLKVASGLPYALMDDFIIDPRNPNQEEGNIMVHYDGINAYRLSSTQEVNLSMDYLYEPNNGNWKANIALGITNALDAENIYNRSYYIDTREGRAPSISFLEKSSLSFTPNLSVRVEW